LPYLHHPESLALKGGDEQESFKYLNVQLSKIGEALTLPTAPQMTDVAPNKCGELMSSLKEPSSFRAERRSDLSNYPYYYKR